MRPFALRVDSPGQHRPSMVRTGAAGGDRADDSAAGAAPTAPIAPIATSATFRSTTSATCSFALLAALSLVACSSEEAHHATPGGEVTASSEGAPASTASLGSDQDALGALPIDLTIDLTILPGPGVDRVEAHLTRSKYILFPDGSLHGDRGRSLGFLTRPARQRTLSREAMSDLWLVVRQSGFEPVADSDANASGGGAPAVDGAVSNSHATFAGNPALLAPSAGEVLTILSIRAAGEETTFLERCAPDATEPAWSRVTRAIARLAWATDDPPLETVIQPIRYDFGPDPYQRYRTRPAGSSVTVPK